MTDHENAASRLHSLLTDYRTSADPERTVVETWASALGVPQSQVSYQLTQIAALIPEIKKDVSATGDEQQLRVVDEFMDKWARPILTPMVTHQGRPSPGKNLVELGALAALGGVASFLGTLRPQAAMPPDNIRLTLRDQVNRLLEDSDGISSVPLPLRQAILARLHDILWALDHVQYGGGDAVVAATERLVAQIVIYSNASGGPEQTNWYRHVERVAARIWSIFKLGATASESLEGWEDVWKMLPPGSA